MITETDRERDRDRETERDTERSHVLDKNDRVIIVSLEYVKSIN